MLSEPLTLYKLMILYMLKQVKFPLSNSQISEFFLDNEYTTYFTLQQALSELLESTLIRVEITREGEDTLTFFGKKISEAIVEDMDRFLQENKIRLRNEVGVVADYYKNTSQDFTVHCEIREGKKSLFELNLSVPTQEQAEAMCSNWKEKSQEIYSFAMKTLLS